ncbi:hypothetical protein [Streptomyces sp. NPDC046860]|uniref:hypothetical protein n=1 Tax=Streptomyces sp. NPDC046860 TaxID=3154495 RepID=UPI0033DFAFA6
MSTATSGSRTTTERFHTFDTQNPNIYRALERMTARRLAAGATRAGVKDLFEDLRRDLPDGVAGLNNAFSALYARRLIAVHPHWADKFELRRRRSA